MDDLGPTMTDLHAEIGRTLVIWGWLEGEMIAAGIDWKRPVRGDAGGTPLAAFLTALAEPRAVRNLLAHGLASSHADPWSNQQAYVTCRTPDSPIRTITLGELRRTQTQLEKLRYMLRTTLT